jgi:hypothetical protein
MSLEGAINRMLKKFGMVNCHPVETPAIGRLTDDADGDELNQADKELFQTLRGTLLWIVNAGRSDAQFAIKELCRINRPTAIHMIAAKRIVRYFAGTSKLALRFPKCNGTPVYKVHSDSDLAGVEETRKSTTGMAHLLGPVPFLLNSKNQEIVALSTFEAELIALSKNSREILYYRMLAEWLGIKQEQPTILYCDNESTIKFCRNGSDKVTSRTKHIDMRYRHIQTQLGRTISLNHESTDLNIADLFTKPLGKNKFWNFVQGNVSTLFVCYDRSKGLFFRNGPFRGGVGVN